MLPAILHMAVCSLLYGYVGSDANVEYTNKQGPGSQADGFFFVLTRQMKQGSTMKKMHLLYQDHVHVGEICEPEMATS